MIFDPNQTLIEAPALGNGFGSILALSKHYLRQ
jgi:hypothetical protein